MKDASCLALGECGLDKKVQTPLDLQQEVFERQLTLAEKYKKPVIIHCVAAFQELIAIKKKLKLSVCKGYFINVVLYNFYLIVFYNTHVF